MWRKIKSLLILKKIFNQIDYDKKLITIVYNKKIQKKLGINIIDYWRLSGRYKEEEENGQIKIFNSYDHHLLFKGHYSNRQKNGIGEEYNDDGKIIFEGKYVNGKKWKGIEYIYDEYNGHLIFECEYKNGKKEGKGKEYDRYNGDLIFEGNYLNGKRNGEGIEYKYIIYKIFDIYISINKNKRIFDREE